MITHSSTAVLSTKFSRYSCRSTRGSYKEVMSTTVPSRYSRCPRPANLVDSTAVCTAVPAGLNPSKK